MSRNPVVPLLLLITSAITSPALAAPRQLFESPAASVSQTVGVTDIHISYHRPAVKGRDIWGQLVPYGEPWRAGANNATTISFSTPVKVGGRDVPAGEYAFFVLPAKERWTFILNKESKQWGAFFYDADKDVLRLDVVPATAPLRERLAYELELVGEDTVMASLHWEKLKATVPITVDVHGTYQAHLAEALALADKDTDPSHAEDRWGAYFLAAKYWIMRGERLNEAGALLDKAGAIKDSFWLHEYRARLLERQGKVKQALPLLDSAKQLAKGKAPQAYIDGLTKLAADWQKGKK